MSNFKVGDRVNTPHGNGRVVFIAEKEEVCRLLVDLGEGFEGHCGHSPSHGYVYPTNTCWYFDTSDLELIEDTHLRGGEAMMHTANKTITVHKPETPEPLENWKHPYHNKPILVRDNEQDEWKEVFFAAYLYDEEYPVADSNAVFWRYYKFPDTIELTQEELLQIAAEAKGVDVQQIKIKE